MSLILGKDERIFFPVNGSGLETQEFSHPYTWERAIEKGLGSLKVVYNCYMIMKCE